MPGPLVRPLSSGRTWWCGATAVHQRRSVIVQRAKRRTSSKELCLTCGFEAEAEETALFVVGEAGTADVGLWVESSLGSGAEGVGVEGDDVLHVLFLRHFGCEREGSRDLPFIDAVVEVAVVDEEIRAALVAVSEDSQGEVETEDDHVVDAATVVGVDPGRDAEAGAAGLDREVGFAAFAVKALCVLGEQQDRFVCLLPALSEVEVDGLLQFEALGGDLAGAGFKGLRCVEAVAKSTESGLLPP